MTEPVRVGSLRGIMMRGPGVSATLPFYEDMWGLSLSHKEDGVALLRGTGTEPFLYGLKDGPVFGIEYVHFAMPDRASMDALHAQIIARGHTPISAPGAFDDWAGGYGFEMLDPDNRRLRFRTEARVLDDQKDWAKPKKVRPTTMMVVTSWMTSLAPPSRKRSSWLTSSPRMVMSRPVRWSSRVAMSRRWMCA